MKVRAVGIDAAFSNMGFAQVVIDTERSDLVGRIQCVGLTLAQTEKESGTTRKPVRVSSDRLRRANELKAALVAACEGCAFAFVEVPSGTQSAQAAFSLGIAVGVLASCPIPIIEVSPMEVKAAIAGRRVKKGASKADIIDWAFAIWPEAPWLRATTKGTSKGRSLPAGRLLADNEHLADAMASVVAGIATPAFTGLIQLSKGISDAVPRTPIQRSSLRRVKLL